jgi:hypothetical protein
VATQNKLPLGGSAADHQATNSHIRIIPRVPDRTHEQSFAEQPIFKHASLQYQIETNINLPALSQTSLSHETRYFANTVPATFADMARPTSDSHFQLVPGESLASSEPVPLTGFVKLKPNNHNKGSKSWRPLELTDLECKLELSNIVVTKSDFTAASDENQTDLYPIGEGRSYTPQNAASGCPSGKLKSVDITREI